MPRMDEPAPVQNGWIAWRRVSDTRMGCCDCGLVHDVQTKIHKGQVYMRIRRNNRSTAQVRRHKKP